MTAASCVIDTIRRRPGARIPRGELIVDRRFARDYLRWRTGRAAADGLSDAQLLTDFCLAVKLDIACIHAESASQKSPAVKINPAAIKSACEKELFVFWVVDGAFQRAMMTRGIMTFLWEIVHSPDDVRSILSHFSDQAIDVMAQGARSGAHGIIIADDIAYHRGTYTSPEFVEHYLLPIWQAQVMSVRDFGVPVFLHSDGKLDGVLPLIVAAGFDGLQCIEPAAGMTIGRIKEQYGKDLCLMGDVDPALLFAPAEPLEMTARYDRLRRDVGHSMATAGGTGGYIFGTCSGLQAGMSPELVQFMYRLAAELDTATGATPA